MQQHYKVASNKNGMQKSEMQKSDIFRSTKEWFKKEKCMTSVKPFKSKNRDKIDLDASNPNLKKGCDGDFLRQGLTYKILYGFIG